MDKPLIGIVMGTTREGRFGERPAKWLLDYASGHAELDFELVDLRDYPMPLFDEVASPVRQPPENDIAQQWCAKAASLDGFIWVTAEYNRAPPAALKNAIDHLYAEMHKKPMCALGYGAVGAVRAVEHLRLIAVEQQMVPIRNSVHITAEAFTSIRQNESDFGDYAYIRTGVDAMLDQLAWWAKLLKTARASG